MNMGPFQGISPVRQAQQPQPLVLKLGQVFHGTVKQLFPEQTAEVNVGGHRLVAKMEVPLRAGDSHYFVVTSTTPEVQLKIASGPVSQHPSDSKHIGSLAQSLGLTNSKEMNLLLSHIVSKQIPMTKEQLIMAEAWLKALPPEQHGRALQSLEKMASLKVPFTDLGFKSVMAGLEKSGLLGMIGNLSNTLEADGSLPLIDRQRLLQTMGNLAEPFRNKIASSLFGTATLNLASGINEESVLNALKQNNILPSSATLSNWPIDVLTSSGKMPDHTIGNLLKQMLHSTEAKNTNLLIQQFNQAVDTYRLPENLKISAQQASFSPAQIKEMHLNLVRALTISGEQLTSQGTTQLLSLFGLADDTEGTGKLQQLLQHFQNSGEPGMKQYVQQAVQLTENALDGKAFETAMKTILRNMGLGYEHMLSGKTVHSEVMEQLKPQLLSVIQHPAASAQLKESAEQIIHRLNGVQLLSAESGHQQQIVMQIPLQFLGRKMDATLNWTGKMKEDGKIDSDYVRVLFYLQLSSLKETVVDMAVQNRVVTINVYNEDEGLAKLAEPFREALKEGLANADYRLSGISLKPFAEQSGIQRKATAAPAKGVDIRI